MEEPLFYEIPVTGFFSALAELFIFRNPVIPWGRFVIIYLGLIIVFSFWDFVIFTLVFFFIF